MKSKTQLVKDEQLTYEELIALCRKQEEYIKELEEKLKPSDSEKIEVTKPSYDELVKQIDNLNHKLHILIDENDALRWSLTTSHKEMNDWMNRSDMWQENYYEEHKRAEKLYDDIEELEKTKEKLNCKEYESNTITSNFKDFEINSSPSKTIISCEGCCCLEDTNTYNTEETIENCTVKIWSNSDTGKVKIGWWKNDK